MKSGLKYFFFGLLIGFIVLILFTFIRGNKKKDFPQANEPILNLFWLAGSWQTIDEDGGKIIENWRINSTNELEGEGFYILNKDTLFSEYLSIKSINNIICYIAIPKNNGPTLFTLIKRDKDKWIFRNSEHDFPQRIIYSKNNEKSFSVKTEGRLITGLMDGEDHTFNLID